MRLAGGATVAAAVLLLAPVPASAGGPTSVLLASPNSQRAVALYHTDENYEKLATLVGNTPVADRDAPSPSGGLAGLNITWLIHDVQIWRIDQVMIAADGTPWLQTRMSYDSTSLQNLPEVVHRPSDPQAFLALLGELELLTTDPGQVRAAAPDAAPAPPAAAGNQQVDTAAAEEPRAANIDWLWLVIGAAVGAALVIAFRPLVVRRRVSN